MRILKPIILDASQRELIAKDIQSTNDQATEQEATQWLYATVREKLDGLARQYFGQTGSR